MNHEAGLENVVQEVAEVVSFLKSPNEYGRLGASVPRGILLYGPPGSGKTLLAQAVAGEAAVDCFLACSASDFVELYVGRGAARIRSLFERIREQARAKHQGWWSRRFRKYGLGVAFQNPRKPTAILFIDELDALAKTRTQWNSNDEREQTLNQLLTEMDGFDTQATDIENDVTVIVVAASNRADVLDPAILRRFERQIYVGYPSAAGRSAILQNHAKRVKCNRESVDWGSLSSDEHTDGFSGADIRNLINDAAILAVRDGSTIVEQRHLDYAARRIKEMKGNLKESRPVTPFLFR
jgi:cell division protease FtsH